MSDVVLERIAAWEAAGLIDAATAERLRAAEVAMASHDDGGSSISPAGLASSFFGPAVSVVEMFSYLGIGFVLAAWAFLITRLANEAQDPTRSWLLVAGCAVPAAVFFAIGLVLHGRSARLDRAAGVAYLLSVGFVWAGVIANVSIFTQGVLPQVAGAAAAVVAAAAYRWLHPSVLTTVGLLAAITGLTAAGLQLLNQVLYPAPADFDAFPPQPGIPGAIISSVAWIVCAIVIGLIGLAESRGGSSAAERRATLVRFWAGVVAVVGVATSVMRTEYPNGNAERAIEPIVGELIVLVVSAVLVERAFRRESGAYVLAAALGVIIALTDFNFSYFAERAGTEVALLIEGLLLIAIAFVAERLTRRVGRSRPTPPEPPAPADEIGPSEAPLADAGPDAGAASGSVSA
jgi:hypothetical protein